MCKFGVASYFSSAKGVATKQLEGADSTPCICKMYHFHFPMFRTLQTPRKKGASHRQERNVVHSLSAWAPRLNCHQRSNVTTSTPNSVENVFPPIRTATFNLSAFRASSLIVKHILLRGMCVLQRLAFAWTSPAAAQTSLRCHRCETWRWPGSRRKTMTRASIEGRCVLMGQAFAAS